MPVALAVQDLLDYLGGTGAASPRTFYALSVTDATIESRALEPAELWLNALVLEAVITDRPDIAKKAALARAAQLLLGHLRGLLLSGGKVNSYSIGNMSVTKQDVLAVIREVVQHEQDVEAQLLALLVSPGTAVHQDDLAIQDPILGSDGVDRIQLDAPPYQGFG